MPLPLKNDNVKLPNNKALSEHRLTKLLGSFNLHKFLSNSREVLETTSSHERVNIVKNLDLSKETLPMEKIEWCIESDTFQSRIHLKDKTLTIRGILPTVISVYVPLGLVSPRILVGKQILQVICKYGSSWDDEVTDNVRYKWAKCRDKLHKLKGPLNN